MLTVSTVSTVSNAHSFTDSFTEINLRDDKTQLAISVAGSVGLGLCAWYFLKNASKKKNKKLYKILGALCVGGSLSCVGYSVYKGYSIFSEQDTQVIENEQEAPVEQEELGPIVLTPEQRKNVALEVLNERLQESLEVQFFEREGDLDYGQAAQNAYGLIGQVREDHNLNEEEFFEIAHRFRDDLAALVAQEEALDQDGDGERHDRATAYRDGLKESLSNDERDYFIRNRFVDHVVRRARVEDDATAGDDDRALVRAELEEYAGANVLFGGAAEDGGVVENLGRALIDIRLFQNFQGDARERAVGLRRNNMLQICEPHFGGESEARVGEMIEEFLGD